MLPAEFASLPSFPSFPSTIWTVPSGLTLIPALSRTFFNCDPFTASLESAAIFPSAIPFKTTFLSVAFGSFSFDNVNLLPSALGVNFTSPNCVESNLGVLLNPTDITPFPLVLSYLVIKLSPEYLTLLSVISAAAFLTSSFDPNCCFVAVPKSPPNVIPEFTVSITLFNPSTTVVAAFPSLPSTPLIGLIVGATTFPFWSTLIPVLSRTSFNCDPFTASLESAAIFPFATFVNTLSLVVVPSFAFTNECTTFNLSWSGTATFPSSFFVGSFNVTVPSAAVLTLSLS